VLREDQLNYLDPVLMEIFLSNLVSADVVCPESLHSKVVNEAILFQVLHVYNLDDENKSTYFKLSAQE
jgi:hypothetical protein